MVYGLGFKIQGLELYDLWFMFLCFGYVVWVFLDLGFSVSTLVFMDQYFRTQSVRVYSFMVWNLMFQDALFRVLYLLFQGTELYTLEFTVYGLVFQGLKLKILWFSVYDLRFQGSEFRVLEFRVQYLRFRLYILDFRVLVF